MTFKLYKGEKLVLEKKVNMYLTALGTARFKTFSPVHSFQPPNCLSIKAGTSSNSHASHHNSQLKKPVPDSGFPGSRLFGDAGGIQLLVCLTPKPKQ